MAKILLGKDHIQYFHGINRNQLLAMCECFYLPTVYIRDSCDVVIIVVLSLYI